MEQFHRKQSDDPFDPTNLLIQADHEEEHGNHTTAISLRNLANNGITPHSLAIEQAVISNPQHPDDWIHYNPDYNRHPGKHRGGRGYGEHLERGTRQARYVDFIGSGNEDINSSTGNGLADNIHPNYNQGFN